MVVGDDGQWLIDHRARMDRAEALWLARLAEFDKNGLWAADGQLSCVSWLVWRTNMARSTAFDKLRVAHELARRPIVAEALRDGRLSYSAARAITRMDRPDPTVDEALVELAQSGDASIIDVERVVRSYRLYGDQERSLPGDVARSRQVKIVRGDQGLGQIVVTLGDLEVEEFAASLQAFLDLRYRPQAVEESSGEDGPQVAVEAPGEEAPGEGAPGEEAPGEEASRAARRADAFMDLVRTALRHADGGQAAGDDRYLVHLVHLVSGPAPVAEDLPAVTTTLDGRPVDPGEAGMVGCDTSSVAHTVGSGGEPLTLGRKTRQWSTAQRRAIALRDGGRCRFVGCQFAHCDIHHIRPWEASGATDLVNGCCQCPRHHRMLHHGYRVEGDPNHRLRFYRPDGSYLGSTRPAAGLRFRAAALRAPDRVPSLPCLSSSPSP